MSNSAKISYPTNRKEHAERFRACPHCGTSGNNIRTLRRDGNDLVRKCLSCNETHIKDITNGFK